MKVYCTIFPGCKNSPRFYCKCCSESTLSCTTHWEQAKKAHRTVLLHPKFSPGEVRAIEKAHLATNKVLVRNFEEGERSSLEILQEWVSLSYFFTKIIACRQLFPSPHPFYQFLRDIKDKRKKIKFRALKEIIPETREETIIRAIENREDDIAIEESEKLFKYKKTFTIEDVFICRKIEEMLIKRSHTTKYLEFLSIRIDILTQIKGITDKNTIKAKYDMGKFYYITNEYDKAKEILVDCCSSLPEDKFHCLFYLGCIYKIEGKPREALKIFKKSSETFNSYQIYLNIASIHEELGETEQALRHYEDVIKIMKTSHEHKYSLVLAKVYQKAGDLSRVFKCLPFFQNALNIYVKLEKDESKEVIPLYSKLALAHRENIEGNRAKHYMHKAVNLAKRYYGNNSLHAMGCLNNLAILYTDSKKFQEAKNIHKNIVNTKRQMIGEDHDAYLMSLVNLSLAYINMGNLQKAIDRAQTVVCMCEHPKINPRIKSVAIHNLALMVRRTNDFHHAMSLLENSLHLRNCLYPLNHPLIKITNIAIKALTKQMQRGSHHQHYQQCNIF